jgi:D-serine deaminase-like pyridoxal phosphate-dependent protein
MHQRPGDPAYILLDAGHTSVQTVHRKGCYICEDREFARMGLPLCNPCCACAAQDRQGHIPADDQICDDCGHDLCFDCYRVPPQENICTCDTPCCEADIGIGVIDCGSQHCPTHGTTS